MIQMNEEDRVRLTFWQVMSSVFAAAIGVQTHAARQRDFTYGNPLHFIFAGILFTVCFVIAMMTMVNLVLP